MTSGGQLVRWLTVPATPAFYGIPLEIQGALFHGPDPLRARLSNTLGEQVGR